MARGGRACSGGRRYSSAWWGDTFDLISLIVGTCVSLYAVALLLQPEEIMNPGGLLSLLSPGRRALYLLGMTGGYAWQLGWWWTLFTAMYLHAGLLHIFFNVMWIRNLGPAVTDVYGPARAFVLFNAGGVTGFLVSNVVRGYETIGASGSVFGLLAALIVYGRRRGSSLMTTQVWQWAIILFILGLFFPGVNNFAHAGGFAGGWIAAQAMQFIDEKRESTWILVMALALIGVTGLGVVLSFIKFPPVARALGI